MQSSTAPSPFARASLH